MLIRCLLSASLVFIAAVAAPAQGTNWSLLVIAGAAPAPRAVPAVAFDNLRNRLVLFGGGGGTWVGTQPSTFFNDTWEWDGASWTQQLIAAPAPRLGARFVHDESHRVMVLFGGEDAGQKLGDTWEYDGLQWVQRSPALSPSPRAHYGFVYDETRGRCVLFGGYAANEVNDTWEWDGSTWTSVATSTQPGVRHGHAMAYDPIRQRVVLFGGGQGGGVLNDTWEFNGVTWTQMLPSTVPSPHSQTDMVFDPVTGKAILCGGWDGSATLGEVWNWDGTTWAQEANPLPGVRRSHDGARGCTVLQVRLSTCSGAI
jgi:hypothetical protein